MGFRLRNPPCSLSPVYSIGNSYLFPLGKSNECKHFYINYSIEYLIAILFFGLFKAKHPVDIHLREVNSLREINQIDMNS